MVISLCCTYISHLENSLFKQRCSTKENKGHVPSYSEQTIVIRSVDSTDVKPCLYQQGYPTCYLHNRPSKKKTETNLTIFSKFELNNPRCTLVNNLFHIIIHCFFHSPKLLEELTNSTEEVTQKLSAATGNARVYLFSSAQQDCYGWL